MNILGFAGTFILASLLLDHYHNHNWLWFTAFVGFNLPQSSLTRCCPLEIFLKKPGAGKSRRCPEKSEPVSSASTK